MTGVYFKIAERILLVGFVVGSSDAAQNLLVTFVLFNVREWGIQKSAEGKSGNLGSR